MSILPISSTPVPPDCTDVSQIQQVADQLAWNNDSQDNDPSDGYPGPGWDNDRFEPAPHAAAQDAGYTLGYGLVENAMPPGDFDSLSRVCWLAGFIEGVARRRRDDADRAAFEADLEEAVAQQVTRHPSEVIRAVGCIAARWSGGAR